MKKKKQKRKEIKEEKKERQRKKKIIIIILHTYIYHTIHGQKNISVVKCAVSKICQIYD